MQYEVNMKALCALVHFAGKNDIRRYLNGVCIEFRDTETVYVATDGFALGSYTVAQRNEGPATIIVPRGVVERIKLHKTRHDAVLSVGDDGAARLVYAAQSVDVGFKPLDGVFPAWRRIVPAEVSNEPGNYNVELLGKFVKANKVFGASAAGRFLLHQNGERGAARVALKDEAFQGVIMPWRV